MPPQRDSQLGGCCSAAPMARRSEPSPRRFLFQDGSGQKNPLRICERLLGVDGSLGDEKMADDYEQRSASIDDRSVELVSVSAVARVRSVAGRLQPAIPVFPLDPQAPEIPERFKNRTWR